MKLVKKILLFFLIFIIVAVSIVCLVGFTNYNRVLKKQPLVNRMEEFSNQEHFVTFSEMAEDYRDAVIAVEDHRFYDHGPIDFIAIGRSIWTNIRTASLKEGGSTLTQQVAKNTLLSQEQSWVRKITEIFAAFDLEKNYSKKEIFEFYVNTAYFGDGYYGIYEASHGYYQKEPKDLNLDESSMLAGVVNAPSVYSPTVNMSLAKSRQAHVINKMLEYGYITKEEALSIK